MSRLPALPLLSMLCVVSSSPAEAPFPGREVAKAKSVVMDSFLGYFVGLVDTDSVGYADGARLHDVLPEFRSFYSLPFEDISVVRRWHDGTGAARVAVEFRGGLELPIPFRVLWDTPGAVRATERIEFVETRVAETVVDSSGGSRLELRPLYIFDIVDGRFSLDFDRWLDVLLGRAVDDIDVSRVLLFLVEGTWYGALMGDGYDGQLVVGYFDFRENRILVPVPRRLSAVGSRLRR